MQLCRVEMQNAPISFFLIFPISYLHRRFAVTVGMLADQDWPFWQVSPSKAQIQIRSHSQLSGSTASTRQRETFAKSHRGKEQDAETIEEEGLTFGIRGAEEAVEAERRSPARRRRPDSIMAERRRGETGSKMR